MFQPRLFASIYICIVMTGHAPLMLVKRLLAPKELSPIAETVFLQTWEGRSYREIAAEQQYDEGYIRDIGSRLWQELSQQLGSKVTKKNLKSQLLRCAKTQGAALDPRLTESLLEPLPFPGAPLSFGSPLYIKRSPVETLALAEIQQPGSLIRLQAPQDMGKTSLMNHLIGVAQQRGMHTVLVDVRQAEAAALGHLDRFLRWFCWNLGRQLQIEPEFDRYWFEAAGSNLSCTTYVQEVFLNRLQQPILVAIDKVHRLIDYDELARNFFPLLRSWHEQARVDPNWQKLRLILTYSAELDLPLQPHQSPFNVGLSLSLPMLTPAQVLDLAQGYGLDAVGLVDPHALAPLQELVGGHPYLLQLAFYELRSGALSLEQLLQSAPTSDGIYHRYLQPFWQIVQRDDRLSQALAQMLSTDEPIVIEPAAAHRLTGMGLIKVHGHKACFPCELYRQYFRACLEAQT